MKIKTKYAWEKQKNGKYSIKNIPIFQCFDDPDKGKVDDLTAKEIVDNFYKDVTNGYYPRTHIGHQNIKSFENKPGIGFIDNLKFKSGLFYADISEISKNTFKEIKDFKYPYRSVEYDGQDKKITGLALLESVPPYFSFPILAIEDGKFSKKNNLMIFFKDDPNMEEEIKEDVTGEEPVTEDVGEEEPVTEDVGEEVGEDREVQLDKLIAMMPVFQQMIDFFDSLQDGEIEKEEEEGEAMNEPVAMQKFKSEMTTKFDKLESKINLFEKRKANFEIEEKLQEIAEKNPSVNLEAEKKFLSKFSSNGDKKLYLQKLDMQNTAYPEHRMTQFARNFVYEPKNKTLELFSKEAPGIKKVAALAYKDYEDTINQSNEKAANVFSKNFPKVEDYVRYMVDMEKENPGNFQAVKYK